MGLPKRKANLSNIFCYHPLSLNLSPVKLLPKCVNYKNLHYGQLNCNPLTLHIFYSKIMERKWYYWEKDVAQNLLLSRSSP